MEKRGYGQFIRRARVRKALNQPALARKMNTSPSTISNLEREQHPPTVPDQVNDLVIALGISPIELLAHMGVRFATGDVTHFPPVLQKKLAGLTRSEIRGLMWLYGLDGEENPEEE